MTIPNISDREFFADIRKNTLNPMVDKVNELDEKTAGQLVKSVNGVVADEQGNVKVATDKTGLVTTVNGKKPDVDGNIVVETPKSESIKTINGDKPDVDGNIKIVIPESVSTINGNKPDANGNIIVPEVPKSLVLTVNNEVPDAQGNVKVVADMTGAVKSINGNLPDAKGNVKITAETVIPVNVMTAENNSEYDLNVWPVESGVVRLGGSNPNAPDWADYGNVLNVLEPKSDTCFQLVGNYADSQKLAWRGGNKSSSSLTSRPFQRIYHENDKPTPAELGVYSIPEIEKKLAALGAGHGGDGQVQPSGNYLYKPASSLGIVFDAEASGEANSNILRTEAAKGALYLYVDGNFYLDNKAAAIVVNNGIEIKFKPGCKVTYKSNQIDVIKTDKNTYHEGVDLFKIENTTNYPFYREYDATWDCANDYITGHLSIDGYASVAGIVSLRSNHTGNGIFQLTAKEDNPLAPTKTKGPRWGVSLIHFSNLVLEEKRSSAFITMNNLPYDLTVIRGVRMRNCVSGLVWGTTSNHHQWGLEIMAAGRQMIVENIDWENDIGCWAGEGCISAGTYVALVGNEANICVVENIRMKNIILRGDSYNVNAVGAPKRMELYSVYPSGYDMTMTNHTVINMYTFDSKQQNVGIKLKKTWSMDMDSVIRRFEEDFFYRMLHEHQLDVEKTNGTFINYYPEPGAPWDTHLDYGTSIAHNLSLRNCKIFMPKLQILNDPEGAACCSSFEITDCDFESDCVGDERGNPTTFNLLKIRWVNNTGLRDNSQEINRRAIFKRNRVYVPGSRLGVLVNVSMQDDRQWRDGMYVVDCSDNDVVCKNVREVMINCSGMTLQDPTKPLNPLTAYIDRLTIDNRVTRTGTGGTHQQFTWGQSNVPFVKELRMGGVYTEPDMKGIRLDQNMVPSIAGTGNYEINTKFVDTTDTLELLDIHNLAGTTIKPISLLYTGTILNNSGNYNFMARVNITDVKPDAITFSYTDAAGKQATSIFDNTIKSTVEVNRNGNNIIYPSDMNVPFKFMLNTGVARRDKTGKFVGTKTTLSLVPSTKDAGFCKINLSVTQL